VELESTQFSFDLRWLGIVLIKLLMNGTSVDKDLCDKESNQLIDFTCTLPSYRQLIDLCMNSAATTIPIVFFVWTMMSNLFPNPNPTNTPIEDVVQNLQNARLNPSNDAVGKSILQFVGLPNDELVSAINTYWKGNSSPPQLSAVRDIQQQDLLTTITDVNATSYLDNFVQKIEQLDSIVKGKLIHSASQDEEIAAAMKKTVKRLLKMLKYSNPYPDIPTPPSQRAAAARCLGCLGWKQQDIIDALQKAVGGMQSGKMRIQTTLALVKLEVIPNCLTEIQKMLIDAQQSKDEQTRIDSSQALTLLSQLLEDKKRPSDLEDNERVHKFPRQQ